MQKLVAVVFLLATIIISGCASIHFTQENIMRLRVGMSDKEIIEIFGLPTKTEAGTCGQSLKRPWKCITWQYGKYSFDSPRLTFQQTDDGTLLLNNWEIN